MIMVTNLNVWTDTAVDISCEVHIISFRGGRLTSLTIQFRTRRVYLFSKLLVSHKVHSTPTNHARIIEHMYSYTHTRRFIRLSANKRKAIDRVPVLCYDVPSMMLAWSFVISTSVVIILDLCQIRTFVKPAHLPRRAHLRGSKIARKWIG